LKKKEKPVLTVQQRSVKSTAKTAMWKDAHPAKDKDSAAIVTTTTPKNPNGLATGPVRWNVSRKAGSPSWVQTVGNPALKTQREQHPTSTAGLSIS